MAGGIFKLFPYLASENADIFFSDFQEFIKDRGNKSQFYSAKNGDGRVLAVVEGFTPDESLNEPSDILPQTMGELLEVINQFPETHPLPVRLPSGFNPENVIKWETLKL